MKQASHMGLRAAMVVALAATAVGVIADDEDRGSGCKDLPSWSTLKTALDAAVLTETSGLNNQMWATLVNRDGVVCAVAFSGTDRGAQWPGSRVISSQKANTANAFSLDTLALSTARLYTLVQPGHSLFGLNNSNPFDPRALASPRGNEGGEDHIAGGIITFGGGVPVYNAGGSIIGGLGVSGDTACTDHEIAKRVRDLAGLNPPGGPLVDDITYSSKDGASVFTHPVCANTFRNGVSIGNEKPALGY